MSMGRKGILGVLFFMVFGVSLLFYTLTYPLNDEVSCKGDSLDYQSLAVNVAQGHGYQLGALEGVDVYRMTGFEEFPGLRENFESRRGYDFYRAPGYPLFMSIIYSFGGVHPKYIKGVQMILSAFSAALLVLLGALFWGDRGGLTGGLAGLIYTFFYAPAPDIIMTESLLIVSMLVWVLGYIFWKRRRSMLSVFVLGVLTASMFLIKEICFFIPMIWSAYYILFLKEDGGRMRRVGVLSVFFCGLFLTMLPWSLYARSKTGDVVITTTHAKHALLDGNNEDSFAKGNWRADWRKERAHDIRYLYNRPGIKDKPYIEQYAGFLWEYRRDIPKLFITKIKRAFTYNKLYFWCLFFMAGYYALQWLIYLLKGGPLEQVFGGYKEARFIEVPVFFFLDLVLITVVLFAYERFTSVFMIFFLPCAVHGLVLIGHFLFGIILNGEKSLFKRN